MVSHSHWCIFLNKSLNQKAILYRQMQYFSPLEVAPVVPYKEWEFISNEAIQPKSQSTLISKSQNTRMNLFKRPSQYLKCFVCLCLCLQPFSIFLQSCVAQGFIKSGMCLQYIIETRVTLGHYILQLPCWHINWDHMLLPRDVIQVADLSKLPSVQTLQTSRY